MTRTIFANSFIDRRRATKQPLERVLDALSARGSTVRETSNGYEAQCPAHEDRQPSLSISTGMDSRVLLHCHADCTVDSIVAKLGLSVSDLMPRNGSCGGNDNIMNASGPRRQPKRQRFASHEDAIKALEVRRGPVTAKWQYESQQGDLVGVVLRWDTEDGKTFLPLRRESDGWVVGGMRHPRPLYGLPDLVRADDVLFIVEGEKAADAGRYLGLTTTTSAHGSKSPEKTDWSPLAGGHCVILPDYDDAGRAYAQKVVKLLEQLAPAPHVKILNLPGLPPGGDLADFIVQEGIVESDLKERIMALAEAEQPLDLGDHDPMAFQPFPLEALPSPVREYVELASKSIGCDAAFVALPVLSALASAIGNSRQIRIKEGWCEPSIVWTIIVGESGTKKSPAFDLATRTLYERQLDLLKQHQDEHREFELELEQYEEEKRAWRAGKCKGRPPEKPQAPPQPRLVVSDITIEAMAVVLVQNPRGVLVAWDELAGWIGSLGKNARGGENSSSALWLSMFNAKPIIVDRKTGEERTIVIPRAIVSLTGGIQPNILAKLMTPRHRESGLAARFLIAFPPRNVTTWSETQMQPDVAASFESLVDELLALSPEDFGDGVLEPVTMTLDPEAKAAWVSFYDEHRREMLEMEGDLAAAWAKLEAYAARFALILHTIRAVAAGPEALLSPLHVDGESMKLAVRLTRWFGHESRRLYARFNESDEDRELQQAVNTVRRCGGSITVRDYQRCRSVTSATAESELERLVQQGFGEWRDIPSGPKGGRPTRMFVLVEDAQRVSSHESEPAA